MGVSQQTRPEKVNEIIKQLESKLGEREIMNLSRYEGKLMFYYIKPLTAMQKK